MIEAIIFDYGGVIVSMGHEQMAEIERRHGLNEGAFRQCLYGTPEALALFTGAGTREAYVDAVHRALAEAAGRPMDEGYAEWLAGTRPLHEDVVELARRLRDRYIVAILSNASDRLEADLAERGIAGHFETVLNSHRLGMLKPDPRIYAHAAAHLGLTPAACVFVDDLPINAEAATAAGMHGIHFTDYGALAAALRGLGVTWDEQDAPLSPPQR